MLDIVTILRSLCRMIKPECWCTGDGVCSSRQPSAAPTLARAVNPGTGAACRPLQHSAARSSTQQPLQRANCGHCRCTSTSRYNKTTSSYFWQVTKLPIQNIYILHFSPTLQCIGYMICMVHCVGRGYNNWFVVWVCCAVSRPCSAAVALCDTLHS